MHLHWVLQDVDHNYIVKNYHDIHRHANYNISDFYIEWQCRHDNCSCSSESATSHYAVSKLWLWEMAYFSPLRRLCIRMTSLNAQLTLGTSLALRIRIKACCNVERADSSEKLTTETVQKIADIKGREPHLTSFRIVCKSRGQSTESSMIFILNNGRDFDTFEILRVTNTTHFWRSYNKGYHNKPFLRRKPLKTRFAPALRTPSDDSKSKVLFIVKKSTRGF